jgi:hypothetical protein
MRLFQVGGKTARADTKRSGWDRRDFTASNPDCHAISCWPVKPPQTYQKYVAAVLDLGNIAVLSAAIPLTSQPQLLAWKGHSLGLSS